MPGGPNAGAAVGELHRGAHAAARLDADADLNGVHRDERSACAANQPNRSTDNATATAAAHNETDRLLGVLSVYEFLGDGAQLDVRVGGRSDEIGEGSV